MLPQGTDVRVTNLIPELDVVYRYIPREARPQLPTSPHLELPGFLGVELMEITVDLPRCRELEDERRLIRTADVAVYLHAGHGSPNKAHLGYEGEIVDIAGIIAGGVHFGLKVVPNRTVRIPTAAPSTTVKFSVASNCCSA